MTISYKPFVALVGCGDWGKNIARTLAKMEVLSCIVDPSDAARGIAEDLKVPIFTLTEVLEKPFIQGVVIATPTPTHFPLAEKILQHRKSVFVEKPMATSADDISSLKRLADDQGLTLMVGHLLLYHQGFQKLLSLVDSGGLGRILRIMTSRKNLGKIHAHEGVLWDLGPHDFSMILRLMQGLPSNVLSFSENYVYENKSDIQTLLMRYQDGPSIEVSLSRIHPFKEQKVIVVGTKGSVVFDDTKEWAEKLSLYPASLSLKSSLIEKKHSQKIPLDGSEPLREEMAHFIRCIEEKKSPLSCAVQAQHVLSLIQACEASERQKAWVSL